VGLVKKQTAGTASAYVGYVALCNSIAQNKSTKQQRLIAFITVQYTVTVKQ